MLIVFKAAPCTFCINKIKLQTGKKLIFIKSRERISYSRIILDVLIQMDTPFSGNAANIDIIY